MSKQKLDVSDFYFQFFGHNHHNDAGDHQKPEWHKVKNRGKHKPLDLKALRNRKKTRVTITKDLIAMRKELMKHKAK